MNDDESWYGCIDAFGNEWPEHDWTGIGPGESGECGRCGAELNDGEEDDDGE